MKITTIKIWMNIKSNFHIRSDVTIKSYLVKFVSLELSLYKYPIRPCSCIDTNTLVINWIMVDNDKMNKLSRKLGITKNTSDWKKTCALHGNFNDTNDNY